MSDEDSYEYEEEYGDSYLRPPGGQVGLQAALEQKDKDLVLAAELGKALLEKNEELEKKLEQTSEEYSQKIEEIQQEKHALHLRYENLEGEYENTVKELQYDLAQLREELDKTRLESHAEEKERTVRIRELTQQNERLQEELSQFGQRQVQQDAELQDLRTSRLASLSSKQEGHIEHLQEQIVNLTERKCQLERHLERVTEERESILGVLDEAQDRIKVLERHKHEADAEIQRKDENIRELHERNSELSVQLDHVTEKASNSSGHSMTLYSELSQLNSGPGGGGELAMTIDSPINQYPPSMFGDEDIECDDDDYLMTSSSPTHNDRLDRCQQADNTKMEEEMLSAYRHLRQICQDVITQMGDKLESDEHDDLGRHRPEMEEEILSAYRHLRQICRDIKTQMGDKLESDEQDDLGGSDQESDDTGSLHGVVLELKDVIHSAIDKSNQTQSCHMVEIESLQQRVGELERDLHLCQGSLQELQKQLHHRDTQIQHRQQRLNELNKQVSAQHEDIKQLSSQRDKLQDMMAADKGRPQMYSVMALLRHARRERDSAVEKRYNLEKELQQARYEVIVLNHQLMEAIQQKNTVSQLLDQWQADMANLLGVRMEKSLEDLKKGESAGNKTLATEDR